MRFAKVITFLLVGFSASAMPGKDRACVGDLISLAFQIAATTAAEGFVNSTQDSKFMTVTNCINAVRQMEKQNKMVTGLLFASDSGDLSNDRKMLLIRKTFDAMTKINAVDRVCVHVENEAYRSQVLASYSSVFDSYLELLNLIANQEGISQFRQQPIISTALTLQN